MPKFAVMSGGTHLGDLEAGNKDAALSMARKAFPGVSNLTIDGGNDDVSAHYDRVNPVSASEMKKAIDRMIGRTA